MIFDKMVKTKEVAIEKANEYYSSLKNEIDIKNKNLKEQYDSNLTEEQKNNRNIFNNIFMTPKQFLDSIYESQNFKEYLRYSLAIKSINKKISLIEVAIIGIALLLGILIILLMHINIISIIIVAILLVGTIIILAKEKTGTSYSEFYMNTMSPLILSILPGYRFHELEKNVTEKVGVSTRSNNKKEHNKYYVSSNILNSDELKKHFDKDFDYYKEHNTLLYSSPDTAGGMCDLEIIKEEKSVNKQTGQEEINKNTILDGFFIENKIKDKSNLLDGLTVEIREDDNFLSSLTEDTMLAIHQSEKNYTFNSEELNKALDCKIKGQSIISEVIDKTVSEIGKIAKRTINDARGVETVEEDTIVKDAVDPAFVLEQVMTPALEEHLIYIMKRYNAFNMNLTNDYISFNVNLNKSLFQKYKSNEIFSSNKYKQHTESVSFIKPSLHDTKDFEYYNVFPMVEKIFFIHYLNLLYRFALKNKDVTAIEIDLMKNFENEMNEIINEDYSEFKNLYIDDLKEIESTVKSTIEEINVNE